MSNLSIIKELINLIFLHNIHIKYKYIEFTKEHLTSIEELYFYIFQFKDQNNIINFPNLSVLFKVISETLFLLYSKQNNKNINKLFIYDELKLITSDNSNIQQSFDEYKRYNILPLRGNNVSNLWYGFINIGLPFDNFNIIAINAINELSNKLSIEQLFLTSDFKKLDISKEQIEYIKLLLVTYNLHDLNITK
jgi:hypothetical protein